MPPVRLGFQSRVPAPREFVWGVYTRPGMFERLTPPWQTVETVASAGNVQPGDRRVLRLQIGPVSQVWEAVHGDWKEGHFFTDRQTRGPFARWEHRHSFLDAIGNRSAVRDDLVFQLPLPAGSDRLVNWFASRQLRRMFRYRHFTTFHDVRQHYQFAGLSRKRIAVSGAPETVAQQLVAYLSIGGHHVVYDDAERENMDIAVELRPLQAGRVSATIRQTVKEGSGLPVKAWEVVSAVIISDQAAVGCLLRNGPEGPIRWTTVDDFVYEIHRIVVTQPPSGSFRVFHPKLTTPHELAWCCGIKLRRLRRGDLHAVDQRRNDGCLQIEDASRRSRFRDVWDALDTINGRIH